MRPQDYKEGYIIRPTGRFGPIVEVKLLSNPEYDSIGDLVATVLHIKGPSKGRTVKYCLYGTELVSKGDLKPRLTVKNFKL